MASSNRAIWVKQPNSSALRTVFPTTGQAWIELFNSTAPTSETGWVILDPPMTHPLVSSNYRNKSVFVDLAGDLISTSNNSNVKEISTTTKKYLRGDLVVNENIIIYYTDSTSSNHNIKIYNFRENSLSGDWVPVEKPAIKVDGTWTDIQKGFVKKDGVWQQFYPSSGTVEYTTPGTYTFKVPPGVRSLTIDLQGAGGGGGGSSEVGSGGGGGGGGSGGYIIGQTVAVTPGETLTIRVGQGGRGAVFVGRTTAAPGGEVGGASSVSGPSVDLYVSGGGGGAGAGGEGGGGGGKIICTKLYNLGLMDKNIYEADQAFGAELVKTSPDIYNGYRAWAEIVVDWMEGNGPNMMPWMSEDRRRTLTQQWSVRWAKDIATPWAEEMAYKMGQKESGSLTGKLITAVGIPICKAVGVWQRIVGPSKKPAGFSKGLMLIPVFVMFKMVAELGRLIERKQTCTA